jgi:hypothetical protein
VAWEKKKKKEERKKEKGKRKKEKGKRKKEKGKRKKEIMQQTAFEANLHIPAETALST